QIVHRRITRVGEATDEDAASGWLNATISTKVQTGSFRPNGAARASAFSSRLTLHLQQRPQSGYRIARRRCGRGLRGRLKNCRAPRTDQQRLVGPASSLVVAPMASSMWFLFGPRRTSIVSPISLVTRGIQAFPRPGDQQFPDDRQDDGTQEKPGNPV